MNSIDSLREITPQTPILDAALIYSDAGIPVLPLVPPKVGDEDTGKQPLVKGGVHAATRNKTKIRRWWKRWPKANIGIGMPPGYVCLDVDPRNGGEIGDDWPETLTASSGGGGSHLIYRGSVGRKVGKGVDTISPDSKYIVAAPSIHPITGGIYAWHHIRPVADTLPEWKGKPKAEAGSGAYKDQYKGMTPKKVMAMLEPIDPDMEYPEWYDTGMAVYMLLGSDGLDVWEKWSSKAAIRYEPGACAAKWVSICRDTRGDFDPVLRLQDLAGKPKAKEEFDDVKPDDPLSKLNSLSLTHRLDMMKDNLTREDFVLDALALSGQITLFYAKPGTGKTLLILYLLMEAIKGGKIRAEDVYYVNADDSYSGLYTKGRIAQEFGFNMISPAESNTPAKGVLRLFSQLAKEDEVHGKVIILDTLKKFADMMDKRSQAALYEVLRRIATKGGTTILAGHANKHLDAEGLLVYEGTSDTMNDVDCAYSIYRMTEKTDEHQVVEFRNEKDRGRNVARATYSYMKNEFTNYRGMLDTLRKENPETSQDLEKVRLIRDLKERYDLELGFIAEELEQGPRIMTEIITAVEGDPILTKRRIEAALKVKAFIGTVWEIEHGSNNSKVYRGINQEGGWGAETGD